MTSDEAPGADGRGDSRVKPLPFDTSRAHQARVYDYLLGGRDNYAADRAYIEEGDKIYSGWASTFFSAQTRQALEDNTRRMSLQQYIYRTREEVARFFEGTDLVEPGIVPVGEWRLDPGAGGEGTSSFWCAVGHKR